MRLFDDHLVRNPHGADQREDALLCLYFITIFVFRQLELETSARHSETMKVGDRNWFVDVGLLNVHKVGGWESDDHEHLSVIIWQEEATRNVLYFRVVFSIATTMSMI